MLQDDNIKNQNEDVESGIDLIEIFKNLWNGRRLLLKGCIFGAIIGVIIGVSTPKQYRTTIKLSPELSDMKNRGAGNFNALASMAGINLQQGATADAVYPDLYPEVVKSIPFVIRLVDIDVTTTDGDTMKFSEYIENETKHPWWSGITSLPGKAIGGIISLIKGNPDQEEEDGEFNPSHLTKKEWAMVNAVKSCLSVTVDNKTSVISISTTTQDPMVSAALADTVAENLKKFIADYRTSKAVQDELYAQKLNDEAREEYYAAQQRYADYVDKNHNVTLNSRKTEEERLRNEVSLAFNLYNSTSTLLQQSRAKVQQDTPVYAVIQPATVPLEPTSSTLMKLIIFAFLGVFMTGIWVVFGRSVKDAFAKIKGREPETE